MPEFSEPGSQVPEAQALLASVYGVQILDMRAHFPLDLRKLPRSAPRAACIPVTTQRCRQLAQARYDSRIRDKIQLCCIFQANGSEQCQTASNAVRTRRRKQNSLLNTRSRGAAEWANHAGQAPPLQSGLASAAPLPLASMAMPVPLPLPVHGHTSQATGSSPMPRAHTSQPPMPFSYLGNLGHDQPITAASPAVAPQTPPLSDAVIAAAGISEAATLGAGQLTETASVATRGRRSLPRVLMLHTGGTLGMDPYVLQGSPDVDGDVEDEARALRPATMLANVLSVVPELTQLSDVHLQVCFNKDSSRVGPADWVQIAQILHNNRDQYAGFLIIHGTDTLAYTASALSLMLQGFNKPVVCTGSQLPLSAPRTDARQNLLDSIQCATAACLPPFVRLKEVAICFGGRLMRGNRTRKVHSMLYQAFDSPGYPYLAQLGIDVAWNEGALLRPGPKYTPRFSLDPHVMRVPVTPGLDPRQAYGDIVARGVKGVVLEVFGVGNIPDQPEMGWIPWLASQMARGLQVVIVSQCAAGPLGQDMYEAGTALSALTSEHTSAAVGGGAVVSGEEVVQRAGGSMTPECAVVKLMMALANPDVVPAESLAGEI